MNVEIPSEELKSVTAPILERAAAKIADQLMVAAKAFAQERESGMMEKEEAAQYLKISLRALEMWMKPVRDGGKGLPHFKIGETVRFSRGRIDAWAMTQEKNPVFVEVAA